MHYVKTMIDLICSAFGLNYTTLGLEVTFVFVCKDGDPPSAAMFPAGDALSAACFPASAPCDPIPGH